MEVSVRIRPQFGFVAAVEWLHGCWTGSNECKATPISAHCCVSMPKMDSLSLSSEAERTVLIMCFDLVAPSHRQRIDKTIDRQTSARTDRWLHYAGRSNDRENEKVQLHKTI